MTLKFGRIILSVFVIVPATLAAVDIQTFFPYGATAGDLRVPTADDNFVEVDLTGGNQFHFFNTPYSKVFVNNNGGVSFVRGVPEFTPSCGPSTVPMIIPYWADVNTVLGGNVWYRESTDAALLQQATAEVHRSFPGIQNLQLNWMFIATWDDVPFFGATDQCGGLALRNNFQTILVTDGTKSFAMFYFNKITWTTGTASGGTCEGLGGTPAKSGFDLGDGVTFFQLPGSCSADIMGVTSTSNVNQEGKWIFRIDESFEASPESANETSTEPEPIQEASTEPEAISEIPEMSSSAPEVSTSQPELQDQCDPSNCQHVGHCYDYSICSHLTRTWERRTCSSGLFWNPPHRANNTNEECTASCDIWDNLSEATKTAYKADTQCFPACYYLETAECSGNYIFHSHDTDNRDVRMEHCPVDTRLGRNVPLVWVQARETCDFCYNAVGANGSPCCTKYDDVEDMNSTTNETIEFTTTETQEVTAGPVEFTTAGAGEITAWPIGYTPDWTNQPELVPASSTEAPAAAPTSWDNAPAGAPASWTNAPAGAPASWTNAPAGAPASWTNAPAGAPDSWTTYPAATPGSWANAPAGAPTSWENNAPAGVTDLAAGVTAQPAAAMPFAAGR